MRKQEVTHWQKKQNKKTNNTQMVLIKMGKTTKLNTVKGTRTLRGD